MDVKIFEETPEFLAAIRDLNHKDENQVALSFIKVVEDCLADTDVNCSEVDEKDILVSSLYVSVLERVAFFPLKPAVMQEELVRLGLKESHSQSLARIWAENAKKVVAARRKVKSDLEDVHYEVLVDTASQEEHVNLHLIHRNGQTTILSYNVEELVGFYKQIEKIQASIDLICK